MIEDVISETQSGFRQGKCTGDGIFNMRTICGRYNDVQKDALACFVDYEKVFDRVNPEILIMCVRVCACACVCAYVSMCICGCAYN